MEHEVRIDLGDGKVAIARYREVTGAPIVVISHGMTAHMNGRIETNFARLLESGGYSSLRYNAYDWDEDARNLCDMGLREHIEDMDAAIAWACERSSKVIALGHSFGAMTLVLRGTSGLIGGIAWDPANQHIWPAANRESATFDAERHQYVHRERVAVIYSERIIEEVEAADIVKAAEAWDLPLLVVSAHEWPHLLEAGREIASLAPLSQLVEMPHADHNFTSDESENELFATTLSWIQNVCPLVT